MAKVSPGVVQPGQVLSEWVLMGEVLPGLSVPGEVSPGYAHRITEQDFRWVNEMSQPWVCPKIHNHSSSRVLDQDVEVPIMLHVPCGHLGVRAASPEDIRSSGPFDRPA